MTKNDGGPAFPCPDAGEEHFGARSAYMGLSLRDYFAAKFMQGFIASPDIEEYSPVTKDECAKRAYQMADTMLNAREALE
jgi:hypothetical protein